MQATWTRGQSRMTDKTKIILSVISLAVAFAVGRYSSNEAETKVMKESIVSKTNTVEQEQKDKSVHEVTKTVSKKAKDGSSVTMTTTDMTTEVKDKDQKEVDTIKKEDKLVTDTKKPGSRLNISVLASINLAAPKVPTVGLLVSKEILGPVTAGVFGYSNSVIGFSLGLDF